MQSVRCQFIFDSSGLIIGSFHAVTVNRQNFQTLRMRFGFRFGHLYRDCLRIFCNYIRLLSHHLDDSYLYVLDHSDLSPLHGYWPQLVYHRAKFHSRIQCCIDDWKIVLYTKLFCILFTTLLILRCAILKTLARLV